MVGRQSEHSGIAKHGAKMVHAVSVAKVPKITCVLGGSYGAGNYGMCGRAYSPWFMYMLPSGKVSVMGGDQAAHVLTQIKYDALKAKKEEHLYPPELQEKEKHEYRTKYNHEGHAYYGSAWLWDDGIIQPKDMRRVLGMSLIASLNAKIEETIPGVYRM